MSATLAAVTPTVCTSLLSRSAPMCAFMPKYHGLPLRVWCLSGSRFFSWFLVEGGAAIRVASTSVPSRSNRPRAVRSAKGRVHQRPFAQQQAPRGPVGADGSEEAFAQIMGFEQAAEFQPRGRVRHADRKS